MLQLKRVDSLLFILIGIFCFLLLLSNFLGGKCIIFPFFPRLALTSGTLLYPFTFLLSDLVTEIWGSKTARIMVLSGLFISTLALLFIQFVLILPVHPDYSNQLSYLRAFKLVFSINIQMLGFSLLAFFIAQMTDIALFQWIKIQTQNRSLWLRTFIASFVAQLIDTAIVNCSFLTSELNFTFEQTFFVIFGNLLYKTFCMLAITPFFYFLVKGLKKWISPIPH